MEQHESIYVHLCPSMSIYVHLCPMSPEIVTLGIYPGSKNHPHVQLPPGDGDAATGSGASTDSPETRVWIDRIMRYNRILMGYNLYDITIMYNAI